MAVDEGRVPANMARRLIDEALSAREATVKRLPVTLDDVSSHPDARPPVARWGKAGAIREEDDPGGLANVDTPRPLYYTQLPVEALAVMGAGTSPEFCDTGEVAMVPNPTARSAVRHGWKVIAVVGDSMEPEWKSGDFVLVEPASKSTIRSGGFGVRDEEGLVPGGFRDHVNTRDRGPFAGPLPARCPVTLLLAGFLHSGAPSPVARLYLDVAM